MGSDEFDVGSDLFEAGGLPPAPEPTPEQLSPDEGE